MVSELVRMVSYDTERTKAQAMLLGQILSASVRNKKHILEVASAFDTETTSFITHDGQEASICYIWQFGIEDVVVYGRWLEDFKDMIEWLNVYLKSNRLDLIVYVHFLKYDFAFIRKYFSWSKIFMRENRYPMYAQAGNIQFRDSLVLSGGQSLAKIGKGLKKDLRKAVGDLDYSLIRFPQTPMTEKELHYCEYDIRVLVEYIREKIEEEGTIANIPYTNTGYVRRYVKAECFKRKDRYLDLMDNLTLDVDAYRLCEQVFGGGDTGPNIKYVNQIRGNVGSFDIKSSYPYQMVTGYFPMSFPVPVKEDLSNRLDLFEEYLSKYCCMWVSEFFNLEPIQDNNFPMHRHKCLEAIGATKASGRIISATYVRVPLTELDYDTMKRAYRWDHMRISRFRIMERGPLPESIINSILHFFYDKTTLDGVESRKADYMIAKNMLNAVYGMMVECPIKPTFRYTGEKFDKIEIDYASGVEDYNNKINRFLYYPWGVWVTAHARHMLNDAIFAMGDDYLYSDTDCVKFLNPSKHYAYFEEANKTAIQKAYELSNRLDKPIEEVAPFAPDGSQKFLGVWEQEKHSPYRVFKTIGAKRYLIMYDNGKIELTVAGTNKISTCEFIQKVAEENGKSPFEVFSDNLSVPPEYAKRTTSKWIDEDISGYYTDYLGNNCFYQAPSGIYTEPSGYSFSVTDEIYDAIMMLCHEGKYEEDEL